MSGWDLIAKYPALRAVTPEGDLISVSGVHIANPDGAGVAMLETAEVALEKSSTALARAESLYTAARRDFDASRQVERAALEHLESAEAGLAGRSEAMWRLQKSVDSIEEEQARLEVRKAALTDTIDQGQRQIAELRSRLQALAGEDAERMRVWVDLEGRRLQLAADREVARSEWQDAAGKLRSIVERERLLQERLARIDVEFRRLQPGHGSEADPDRLAAVESFARRAVSVLTRRIEELRDRQTRLRHEKDDVLGDLEAVGDEHISVVTAIDNARERDAELDVRLAELRLHREAVVESIRRDADSDVDAAMGAPRPERPEDTNLEELLESRSAQLSRLGPINPLAAEEFRELDERHTFLSDQMTDIESSRSELRKVITALEEEIELRFQAAFSEVAEAYERYFGVLFPGGRGRLRVIDTDDTQSGVAIDAQPLGKKVTQMAALGWRAEPGSPGVPLCSV